MTYKLEPNPTETDTFSLSNLAGQFCGIFETWFSRAKEEEKLSNQQTSIKWYNNIQEARHSCENGNLLLFQFSVAICLIRILSSAMTKPTSTVSKSNKCNEISVKEIIPLTCRHLYDFRYLNRYNIRNVQLRNGCALSCVWAKVISSLTPSLGSFRPSSGQNWYPCNVLV